MTNDSWSGAVSAEMQHLALAVFVPLKIENRLSGDKLRDDSPILPTGKIIDRWSPLQRVENL